MFRQPLKSRPGERSTRRRSGRWLGIAVAVLLAVCIAAVFARVMRRSHPFYPRVRRQPVTDSNSCSIMRRATHELQQAAAVAPSAVDTIGQGVDMAVPHTGIN